MSNESKKPADAEDGVAIEAARTALATVRGLDPKEVGVDHPPEGHTAGDLRGSLSPEGEELLSEMDNIQV